MYNVAIIDPDFNSLTTILRLLERNPFITSITCFNNMNDYLSELKKTDTHVAFIRIGSPELQGLYLARKTLHISPDTKVVFMSDIEGYAVMAFDGGAWGYLLLPAAQEDMDAIIDNILQREGERGDSS